MSYWKHGTLRYLLALVLVLAITASQIVPSYAETNPVSGGDSTISSSAEEDGTPETTETQSTDGGEDSTEETGESLPAESSEANPEETMESLTAESEEAGSEGTTEPQAAESNEAGTEETGTEAADQETDPGTDVSSGDVSSGDAKPEPVESTFTGTTQINGVAADVSVRTMDPELQGAELKIDEGQPNQTFLNAYLGDKTPVVVAHKEYAFGLHLEKNGKKKNPQTGYDLNVTIRFEAPMEFGSDDDVIEVLHYTENKFTGAQEGIESLQVLYTNDEAQNGEDASADPISEITFQVSSFSTFSLVLEQIENVGIYNQEKGWTYNADEKVLTITGSEGVKSRTWVRYLSSRNVTNLNGLVIEGNFGLTNVSSWRDFFKNMPPMENLEINGVNMTSMTPETFTQYLKTPLKSLTLRGIEDLANDLFYGYKFAEGATLIIEDCDELICNPEFNKGEVERPADKGVFASTTGLETVILRNIRKISDKTFLSSSIKHLEITNCGDIGIQAFRNNKNLESLVLKNDGSGSYTMKVGRFAFAGCGNLRTIDLDLRGCDSIGGLAFEDSGTQDVVVTGLESVADSVSEDKYTDLGYSNLFEKLDSNQKTWLENRMKAIWENCFELDTAQTESDELLFDPIVDEKWMSYNYEAMDHSSYRIGEKNDRENTQILKAARWLDDTTAEVQVRFNYAFAQGKDFLFVIDVSDSITDVAGDYKDSKFYNIQSKVLDVATKLVKTEGYSNRVGIVAFSSKDEKIENSLQTCEFTTDAAKIEGFVKGLVPPSTDSTHYDYAFQAAEEMIDNRTETDKEVELIFISDGVPQEDHGGVTEAEELQEKGVTIYAIYQNTKNVEADETASEAAMRAVSNYFYDADEAEAFSKTINEAIRQAFSVKTIVDTIGSDFELVDVTPDNRKPANADDIAVDSGKIENYSSGKITWTVTGLPFTTYTMTYRIRLKKDKNGNYPAESYDFDINKITTNKGNTNVYQGNNSKKFTAENLLNSVASPQLPRYTKLLLTKTLEDYSPDLGGATFVFKVIGTKNNGSEKVFEQLVGMTFDSAGTQSELLEFVPPCDEVTVEEIYSGSYELVGDENVISYSVSEEKTYVDGETVKLYDSYYGKLAEDGTKESDDTFNYSASYTNHYNGSLNGGSGVINVYTTTPNGGYAVEPKSKDDQAD